MRQPVEVELMGQRLTVASEDGAQHVREVAAFVDGEIRRVAGGRPAPSALHLALLTALNIASEYWKLRTEQEELQENVNRVSKRLLRRLR